MAIITEVERIINKGIISEGFLQEETRCGFFVDIKRKKLWAVQLDMLLELDRVCKKYGLKYYLCGGSLLGGIRHHGFIPWDDDLDVALFRSDYEKLLKLAHEFNEPYFLQTPYTDPYYAFAHTRLRNINTTGISKMFAFQPMCQGIYMDIHPIDNWVKDDKESYQRIRELNIQNSTYMRMTNPYLDENNKKRVAEWPGRDPREIYEEVQSIATQYNDKNTPYRIRAVISIMEYEQMLMHEEDYYETILCDFEGFQLPIPVGAKRMLEIRYGNYEEFPEVDKRGAWHHDFIVDADVPYKEYLSEYKKDCSRKKDSNE